MDYVEFEPFSNYDALPSPQQSLSLPLKQNIENLGLKLPDLTNLRNLLKQNQTSDLLGDELGDKLAQKYADLLLQQLDNDESRETDAAVGDSLALRATALSSRLARALNPSLLDAQLRTLFSRLEHVISDLDATVDPGVRGSIARKNLRGAFEADLIRNHAAVLAEYAKPVRILKVVGARVECLESLVSDTQALLASDALRSADLTAQVKTLTLQKHELEIKKALLASFRDNYTLNEYEQFVLASPDINEDFFKALEKAESIRERCLVLLALEDPKLGQAVMAKSAEIIEHATHKIESFAARCLLNLFSLNNKEKAHTLNLCLHYLQLKPELLDSIVNTYVEAHSAELVKEFNSQVSGPEFGESYIPVRDAARPVFYSSHDPVRYIADLLAYVHSLVVLESETILSFLDLSQNSSMLDEMAIRILACLSQPISGKIARLISSETKFSILYQMFNHLELYLMMFERLPHAEKISEVLRLAAELAQERLVTVVENTLATVKSSNLAQIDLTLDLQPPQWIIDFFADILPILDSLTSDTALGLSPADHKAFLNLLVDEPHDIFIKHLQTVSKAMSKSEILIFKVNFVDLILSKIMPIPLLNDKVLEYNHVIHDYTAELTTLQLQTLLLDCKLSDYYNVVQMICPIDEELLDPSIYQAVTENKLFTKEKLQATNEVIQSVLPTAILDMQMELMKLNSPTVVNEIIQLSSSRFATFYQLFAAIVSEYLGENLFSWTSLEVATLLGVEK